MARAMSGSVSARVRQRDSATVDVGIALLNFDCRRQPEAWRGLKPPPYETHRSLVGRGLQAPPGSASDPFASLQLGDLLDPALVSSAVEGGGQPERHDLI